MPWYSFWAICIVLEASNPNLLDAVCWSVDVVNGPEGLRFTILEEMNYPKEILESVKEEKKEKQANMHTTEECKNNICSQTI